MTDIVETPAVAPNLPDTGAENVEMDTGETCEVEKILDQRILPNGNKEYLIKWKGYSQWVNNF